MSNDMTQYPGAQHPGLEDNYAERHAAFTDELTITLAAINAAASGPDVAQMMLEDRILLKLESLDPILLKYGIAPPRSSKGKPLAAPILAMIGHAGARVTKRIREAIVMIDAKHAKSLVTIRHYPEREIDRIIDGYEAEMRERGYGSPRFNNRQSGIDRIATAEEIPCDVRTLDTIAMRRITLINRSIETPGRTTERHGWSRAHRKWNPAVPLLVKSGLPKHFHDGLPEDPMRPGNIDIEEVAWNVGVSFGDIYFHPEHMLLVEDFAKKRELIPNPYLALRRYSYASLMDHGYGLRMKQIEADQLSSSLARRTTGSLKTFIEDVVGASMSTQVPLDFEKKIKEAIANGPSRFGSWWKEDMRRWIHYNRELRATKPLPPRFASALRVLASETGHSRLGLAKVSGVSEGSLKQWITGEAVPGVDQQKRLDRLSDVLGAPRELLTDRLDPQWRSRRIASKSDKYDRQLSRHLPDGFNDLSLFEQEEQIDQARQTFLFQDTAYSHRQREMSKDRYRLKQADWPEIMSVSWDKQIPMVASEADEDFWELRKPGEEIRTPGKNDIPASSQGYRKGGRDFKRGITEAMFGYYTRPRHLTQEQRDQAKFLNRSMTTSFRPQAGLGIPVELLHPVIFLLPDLVTSYIWFRARRSGVPGRILLHSLSLAAHFVRPDAGLVWKDKTMITQLEALKEWWDANPHDLTEGSLKLDLEPFRKNWQKAVKAVFKAYGKEHRKVRSGKMPSTRDPFLPIQGIIDHPNPMEKYMVGVRSLLQSRPPSARSRHVQVRDSIITLVLIQTGLRAATMLFEYDDPATTPNGPKAKATGVDTAPRIMRRVDDDGGIEWHLYIPAIAFKNYHSDYFAGGRPYEHTLRDEDDLYDLLDLYVSQSRLFLLAGERTDAFFVTTKRQAVDGMALNRIYRRITRYHFVADSNRKGHGIADVMTHGPHAVRHIIATHIMKTTGNLHLAAWAIQDSVRTVEQYYARFFPRDKVRLADEELAKARQTGRERAAALG